MTREDFSNSFDTQLNSFAHTAGFGDDTSLADIRVDEYEKSLFLTKAQEELALSLYNGKNPYNDSFEKTEELRRYLAPLIVEAELEPIKNTSGKFLGMEDKNSYFFTLPDGKKPEPQEESEEEDSEEEKTQEEGKPAVWFITYESVILGEGAPCGSGSKLDVIPVRQDEYHKIKKNPFRGANNRRALRLDLSDGVVEIISKYAVTKYYLRYLRKLKPIILDKLDTDAAIEGKTDPQDCELPDTLHQRILELAVRMALQSKGYTINNENK